MAAEAYISAAGAVCISGVNRDRSLEVRKGSDAIKDLGPKGKEIAIIISSFVTDSSLRDEAFRLDGVGVNEIRGKAWFEIVTWGLGVSPLGRNCYRKQEQRGRAQQNRCRFHVIPSDLTLPQTRRP